MTSLNPRLITHVLLFEFNYDNKIFVLTLNKFTGYYLVFLDNKSLFYFDKEFEVIMWSNSVSREYVDNLLRIIKRKIELYKELE